MEPKEKDEELFEVFREFAMFGTGSITRSTGLAMMDSRQLQKLCRDCGLLRSPFMLTKVDIDLTFVQIRGTGTHKIDFIDFCQCLELFAMKRRLPVEAVVDAVRYSNGPTLNAVTTPDARTFSSPLRETPQVLKNGLFVSTRGKSPNTAVTFSTPTNSNKLTITTPSTKLTDWYAVDNPCPRGPDELVYYVNSKTNETRWTLPMEDENVHHQQQQLMLTGSGEHISVFDKL